MNRETRIGVGAHKAASSPTGEAGAPNLSTSSDNLITARGPDPDFYGAARSMFCPASTRLSERAAASERYIGDMMSAALFGGDTDAVRARYADELAEIEERYSLVESLGVKRGKDGSARIEL